MQDISTKIIPTPLPIERNLNALVPVFTEDTFVARVNYPSAEHTSTSLVAISYKMMVHVNVFVWQNIVQRL